MAGIWDAVQQITGFASLVAFMAAALLLYNHQKLLHQTRRLEALPANQRSRAFEALLARFHVETSGLPKAKQHELALLQLQTQERRLRHRFWLALIASILVAVLWGVSIVLHSDPDASPAKASSGHPTGFSPEQFDSLTRLIAAGSSRQDSRWRKGLPEKIGGDEEIQVEQSGNLGSRSFIPQADDLPPATFVNGHEGQVWWPNPSIPPTPEIQGDFRSGMAWVNVVDDQRDPRTSRVEIDYLRLYAHVNGRDVLISSDDYEDGAVGGALFQRTPWFGATVQTPISSLVTFEKGNVTVPVSTQPERVWHIWSHAFPRPTFPEGTTRIWAETRFRIVGNVALQLGFDYFRGKTDIGCDVNLDGTSNPGYCEAGRSSWVSSTPENNGWQILTLGK